MAQEKPLTHEQFVERIPIDQKLEDDPGTPRYDNFISYFMAVGWAASARQTQHSLRFQDEHPALDEILWKGIMNRDKSIDKAASLIPLEPYLYQAYLIMRDYKVSDQDFMIASD